MKAWAISMGIGMAVGAVAVMMMPQNNPTRKLAQKAATKVEDAATQLGAAVSSKLNLQ